MNQNDDATKAAQNGNLSTDAMPNQAHLGADHCVHIAGVTGSSPVSPTTTAQKNQYVKPRAIQCPDEQAYHIKRVREVFAYDSADGTLYRRSTWKRAGKLRSDGYRTVCLDGVVWREHRIVWEWVNGTTLTEDDEIDHINGVRDDNRIENLRKASRLQNQWNARIRKDNTSGLKGVSWNKKQRRWTANISIGGKVKYLGAFATPEEAHAAYEAKAIEVRGEYARTG